MKRGASPEKVEAFERWRETGLFDERERLALEYAEAITLSHRGVDDELMAGLKRHFDDDAVVELTGLTAFQNLSSKFNTALSVPPQAFAACRPRRACACLKSRTVPANQPPATGKLRADLRWSVVMTNVRTVMGTRRSFSRSPF